MQLRSNWFPFLLILVIGGLLVSKILQKSEETAPFLTEEEGDCWTGAGLNQIPVDDSGSLIRYGHDLIEKTAIYLGPNGTVAKISNGMNCQNCHLEAGTKPWGNNFGAVAANYPNIRARSGHLEGIVKRINDCLERSLNGKALDSTSKEMQAMVSYIQWLGKEIPKGTKPKGTGLKVPPLLTRAANPENGKQVFISTCQRCHGSQGEGQLQPDHRSYFYPPLWGEHSYNNGAGIYRLSSFAGFVQNNMPNPTSYHHPLLTNEQAWDVAAFVNSRPRPVKDQQADWPDIRKKPFDHPFGPYADKYSEQQHKFGPWQEIRKAGK